MDIQELIARGRFIFSGAPKRLEVFSLINGRRMSKQIATKTGRTLSSILHDIEKLKDMGLIKPKTDKEGNIIKRENCTIYEKVPLIRHIPLSYFQDIVKPKHGLFKEAKLARKVKRSRLQPLSAPIVNDILDICKHGEDQIYEFKTSGVEIAKVAKEIAAFLNTKKGGLLFYGVEDDGSIVGSDMRRQDFDQALQNSIRNTISPQPNIEIKERDVLGHKILIVIVPPWDLKNIYQYKKDRRVYIRKGTNIFAATPEELKKLGRGKYVV